MTAEEITTATLDYEHLDILAKLVVCGWPLTEAEVQMELQPYWSFRNEIAIIDRMTIKGRRKKYW